MRVTPLILTAIAARSMRAFTVVDVRRVNNLIIHNPWRNYKYTNRVSRGACVQKTLFQSEASLFSPCCLLHSSSKTEGGQNQSSSHFLDEVEATIKRVFDSHGRNYNDIDLESLPQTQRESLAIARFLEKRISSLSRNGDCRRCWLQQKHCICSSCPPLEPIRHSTSLDTTRETIDVLPVSTCVIPPVRRLFLLMNHKEICMAVDTAKLLLAAFPSTCRLVVGGIGPEYQESMKEMMEAMKNGSSKGRCIALFPADGARTFEELQAVVSEQGVSQANENDTIGAHADKDGVDRIAGTGDFGWDVIVLDGTWSQARKLHSRYIPAEEKGGPCRVCLSGGAVANLTLGSEEHGVRTGKLPGLQLRRHPIKWREISTLEATRLLLRDMMGLDKSRHSDQIPHEALAEYQQIADAAARTQIGPIRLKKRLKK